MLRWDVSAEEVKSSFESRRKVKEHLRDLFSSVGEEVESHDPVPHTSYNRNDYLTECLVSESLVNAVLRPDGCWELAPVVMAVHAVNHIALHLYMGEKVPLKMLADIALLLKAHPDVLREWGPALGRTGLTKFSTTVLRATDTLFATSFSDGGGSSRFIRLFVRQEGTKLSRLLGKYIYIPRRPNEAVREIVSKFTRVLKHRL